MANRAYLFSSDRDGTDVWAKRGDVYYDSRWTIPLAWWFLFSVADIRLIGVHYGGSSWQEVKLVADKSAALIAFAGRRELLSRVLGRPAGDVVTDFFGTVRAWPGKYLLMDPEEVFGGGGEPDEGHHRRCLHILETIDADNSDAGDVAAVVSSYSSVGFDSEDEFIAQVVGYTYR